MNKTWKSHKTLLVSKNVDFFFLLRLLEEGFSLQCNCYRKVNPYFMSILKISTALKFFCCLFFLCTFPFPPAQSFSDIFKFLNRDSIYNAIGIVK